MQSDIFQTETRLATIGGDLFCFTCFSDRPEMSLEITDNLVELADRDKRRAQVNDAVKRSLTTAVVNFR